MKAFIIIALIMAIVTVVNLLAIVAGEFVQEHFPEHYLKAQKFKYKKLEAKELKKENGSLRKLAIYQRRLEQIETELNIYKNL